MFVPIYTGASPFMLAATVINAKVPLPLRETMTEWRMSYRFSEMVLQFMSSRLKEAARKAYLNAAADILEDFAYEEMQLQLDSTRSTAEHQKALQQTNFNLATLAVKYPYQQIELEFNDKLVNDSDRQSVTVSRVAYKILMRDNPYWCHYSARNYFTLEVVARKFRSALARSVQRRDGEVREAILNNLLPPPSSATLH
jgi:adenine-specific DNA methylase